MNLLLFTQTNKKGQVVIPKAAGDKLDIKEGTRFRVVVRDQGVHLYPVHNQSIFSKEAYLKVLRATAGAWGPASKDEQMKEKRLHKLELLASERDEQS